MVNIYRKFSVMQKSSFYAGIVSCLCAVTLFIIPIFLDLDNRFILLLLAYALPFSAFLAVGGIVLMIKCRLFLYQIYIESQGISIVTKAGKVKKSFDWTSIRKLALCEDHGRRYVCISTDPDLSPEYTHMYGNIMAPFHCKNCISFPVDPVLIETLEKHSSRSGVVLEHTGSIKNGPIQSTRKISGPIVLIAFIALIMCLILLVWSILFLS